VAAERKFGGCLVLGALCAALAGPVRAANDQETIDGASEVVQAARSRMDFCLRDALGGARGIVVFSDVVSGAFVIGGQKGRGVFMRRAEGETWGNPAFVRLNTLSIGLQAGGHTLDVLALLNSEEAAEQLAMGRMKLTAGAEASVVAGQAGGSATNLTNVGPGVRYYIIDSSGFFAGAKLEGARISMDEDANERFYAGGATKPFDAQSDATPMQAAVLLSQIGDPAQPGCAATAAVPAG